MDSEKNILQIGNPRFCDIVITNRCLLKCKMCKSWQCGPQSNELTFAEAKKFVQSLSEFVKEPLEINVMGGEPLWKDWCLDLCSFISKKGFKSIISTNAYLIDEDMAKRIADSGLNVLAISLESLNPDTHNYIRGKDDVFSKAMKAIEYLDKYCGSNLTLTILTIIMEKNLDEILELTEWVNKNKVLQNISFLALLETGLVQERHNWFRSQTYKDLWPQDTEKVYRLIDQLIRLRKSGYKIWNPISQLEALKDYYTEPDRFMKETQYKVNDYIIDLDENGSIYLSGDVLGNIREDDLKQLWFSDKANQIRRKIDSIGPGKRCCVINFICAFPQDEENDKKNSLQENHDAHTVGFSYLDRKEFKKAQEEFNNVIKLHPNNKNIHHGLGLCYQHEKQFDKAIDELKQGLRIDPEDEHIHQSLGFCYKDLRQFDQAIAEFEKVLVINIKNPNGHIGLGFCYLEQKKVDQAIVEFNNALELAPSNEYAHIGLGSCYQYKKQFDKARVEFEEALKINPGNEHAHYGLAVYYQHNNEFDEAIAEFEKVLKLNPENEDAHQGLGCLQRIDFSDTINELNRALELEPKNVKHLQGLATVYFKQKKYDESSKLCYEILKTDPDNRQAQRYLKEIERPDFCVIEVSHECMFQCKMCNYWKSKAEAGEVSIKDLYRFVSALKDFVDVPFGMNISGGEPLLKKGMLDLIEFIAQEGFKFSMVTNGYLIDKNVAKRLANSGLNFLAISLDSLNAEIHDNLRGIKGAHKKVLEALEYFDTYRGRLENLTVQTIIMGPNLEGILDLVDWSQDKQLSLSFMAITRPNMVAVDASWYKKKEFSFLWPQDTARVHYVLDELIRRKKMGHRIDNPTGQLEKFKLYFSDPERFVKETACSLGDDIVHVNPKGDIYLCCEMESVGNIKESGIGKIWTSQKAKSIREKIKGCQRNCAGMVNCYRE